MRNMSLDKIVMLILVEIVYDSNTVFGINCELNGLRCVRMVCWVDRM